MIMKKMKKFLFILCFLAGLQPAKAQFVNLSKIDSFVNSWIGVKYLYGGTKKSGIDCSAFSREMIKFVYGVTLPRTAKSQYAETKKIKTDSLKTGDLVFFKSKQSPSGWHVGVYLFDNKFVHSANRMLGVIVSDLKGRKIYGAGRVPKDSIYSVPNTDSLLRKPKKSN